MTQTLKHYAAVYGEFIRTCLAEATSFRLHFVLLILIDVMFYLTSFLTVDFIYQHVAHIGVWNREQFLFFVAFMIAIDHLHMTLVAENFWNFAFELRTGVLDFILLKPIGALFPCFFRLIRAPNLINIWIPWGALIYFGQKLDFTLINWVMLPPMVLLGLVTLVSIEIVIMMAVFVTLETYGINFLRMQLQQVSRWPDFVFGFWWQKLFTFVVPVLVIGSVPVRLVMEPLQPWGLFLSLGVCGFCWIATRLLWRRGLKSYQSASS